MSVLVPLFENDMKLLKKKPRKNVRFMHEKVHLLQVARQTCHLVKIKAKFHRIIVHKRKLVTIKRFVYIEIFAINQVFFNI